MRHGYDNHGRLIRDPGAGLGVVGPLFRSLVSEVAEPASAVPPIAPPPAPPAPTFVVTLFRLAPPPSGPTGPVISTTCGIENDCCSMKRKYPAAAQALWDAVAHMGAVAAGQAIDNIVYRQPGGYISTKTGLVPTYVLAGLIRDYGANGGDWVVACITQRS